MRWGVEVWDRFEDVSGYVHKGIEFCERYEEFLKKRCSIENTYAKSLRKLIESYEPKKKEIDENDSTFLKCFLKMLDELRDVAGQHELVAENFQEKVIIKINQTIKTLKDERRKCNEDKEKFHLDHMGSEELLEKCKQKYEKSYKEVEKAEEQLNKVENDDSASKNDIKKQKSICDQKKRQYDTLEAEYAKQLCEANRVKNVYYYQQLPAVFDDLQYLEKKRVENFKELVTDCVKIEVEVLPRIKQCLNEIESSARAIDPDQDTELAIRLYKTGYTIPVDHAFEDLKQTSANSQNQNQQMNGSVNSNGGLIGTSATLSVNSLNPNSSRNKKYRTLNRIKGLFNVTGKSEQESLYDLPPQQLKNELLKKINYYQFEIEKQQKEREGLNKLKDIYSKNQKFGDSQSAESALRLNDEKIVKFSSELKKYQEIYNQIEQQYANSEYSSSSSSTSGGSGNGIQLNGCKNGTNNSNNQHIYQSPSQSSVNSGNSHRNNINKQQQSYPGTPVTPHNQNGNSKSNLDSNGAVAYAISPVSHLNTNNTNNVSNNTNSHKMAPLVNSNESFDEDEGDEDEDEEDYEEGGYESPSTALRAPVPIQQSLDTAKNKEAQAAIGFVYSSTAATEPQYDQVDTCLYDQPIGNGSMEDEIQIGTALVMYSFDGNVQNSISIQENESLNVLERDSGDGWTLVKRLNGEKGYVPTDYIQIVYY